MRFVWLTSVETSELVGIPVGKVVLIEQKAAREGRAVAIFLDNGKEVRVIEPLRDVRDALERAARLG